MTRRNPVVMADIEAEAAALGDPKRAEMVKRVTEMDPPSRASAAVNLLISGASYNDVAKVMLYKSTDEAKRAIWGAIGAIEMDENRRGRERELMARRLNAMISSGWKRANNPSDADHLAYQRLMLAIMDRQAKLYGLDAPSESIVYTPSQAEINEHVARVRNLVIVEAGDVEADVLEGDRAAS